MSIFTPRVNPAGVVSGFTANQAARYELVSPRNIQVNIRCECGRLIEAFDVENRATITYPPDRCNTDGQFHVWPSIVTVTL